MKKISIILIVLMMFALPITSIANEEDQLMTRSEFITELLTQGNLPIEETLESSFSDVLDPQYIPYIETAYNKGITSGYGEIFKPDESVTKEQAVAMIVRVFGERSLVKKLSPEAIDSIILKFSDSSNISSWAKPYIAYAIDKGLIIEDHSVLNPQVSLTQEQSKDLIAQAKVMYEELFTREGNSAGDLLVLSNDKNAEYETYKQKGTMAMNMKLQAQGIAPEVLDNDDELNSLMENGLDMTIEMDIQAETPDKAYIIEVIKSNNQQEDLNQKVEIFMDGSIMYTKMMGLDKWIKQDIGSIMSQIQSTTNSDPYKMSQLSNEQLNFFKDYARYSEDATIDNEEYYVVALDIDRDTYRKYYNEIINKTMDSVIELQTSNPQIQADPNFNEESYREMMTQIMNQMEIEIEYKFYINKETKEYRKMGVSQNLYMAMNNILSMMDEISPEEASNATINMVTSMDGEFEFYDFNGEVTFPEIGPEDLLENPAPQQPPVEAPVE